MLEVEELPVGVGVGLETEPDFEEDEGVGVGVDDEEDEVFPQSPVKAEKSVPFPIATRLLPQSAA